MDNIALANQIAGKITVRRSKKIIEEKKHNQIVNGCELSDEQQAAVNRLIKFCESEYDENNWIITLTGGPGTGKSLSMRALIDHLDKSEVIYRLCAPTHKAKYVLSSYTEKSVDTIHSLFKFSPLFDIQDLNFDDLKFNIEAKKKAIEEAKEKDIFGYKGFEVDGLPYYSVIIVDEASMINSDIFEYFKALSEPMKMRMIMIGDPKQIRPVGEEDISPVFKDNVSEQVKLTKVFRQDNESALLPTLLTLRERIMSVNEFRTKESPKGSIYAVDNIKDFISPYVKIVRKAIEEIDVNKAKIICYTNDRVAYFNILARVCLFKDEAKAKPFLRGEFLMGCENFKYKDFQFNNSSDYMITNDPKPGTCYIPELDLRLPCWNVKIANVIDKWDCIVPFVRSSELSDEERDNYSYGLEGIRMKAVAAKKRGRGKESSSLWRKYFSCLRSFACDSGFKIGDRVVKQRTFTYGYAISAHKSQGSSYDTVFVNIPNILLDKDEEERRELEYVALSRARKDAYVLTVDR